ncbi:MULTISPECIES: hypothetical protein [Bacillus cereus group]|uniref:Uncharacterized protein n=1 Tax=Bacillus cereus TaxID=1396 RepID=A0A1Q4L4E0_BACCE|nr:MULTISPECIES: hypothetical protein [Bacillus cereus group]EJP83502.1 hypothetical protein IAU_05482 [Bacillus cereus IS075]EOO82429.1 hypothetical protein IGS_05786 [Bacillus cereus IS845/00]EOO92568.1 hypothetical protein IGQ_05775 [Bacillus cereus IS195]MDX5927850.1 hypothetical protein [Bacillus cereus group sp. BfR-BA-00967]MDX5975017.1 hypothetical protein [Bacillus cereus group sp. BfR-BA-00287]
MNPLKDKQLTYWLVNLGNMYYAGGLLRKKEDESTFSYEFVNNKTYAFPFLEEHGAMRIAEKCGGTVVDLTATGEELTILEDKNERYINSEYKARLEQELNAREEMKKAEDIQTLEYELEQLNHPRN